VKLTTHLHLVPRLRIGGAIPPLPHKSSCILLILCVTGKVVPVLDDARRHGDAWLHALTSALDGGEWPIYRPGRLAWEVV
jgi:hypothetical protein